jgi:predicted RNase H-like nuclease (RuvC/YqgF family)
MSNDYQIMLDALEKENKRLRDEIERLKDTISEILREVRGG